MTHIDQAVSALRQGKVIAYPTEAVYGVGCDPDNEQALRDLMAVKQRDPAKGLILIAADFEQLRSYVDVEAFTQQQMATVLDSWPGPVSWVMPASDKVNALVHGQFDTVAVRVTDHPLVQQLCRDFGKPITSTSANLSGMPPCITSEQVQEQLGVKLVHVVDGKVGDRTNPSEIRDARTLKILRQG